MAKNTEGREDNRYIIQFDEYAEISLPDFWTKLGGLRNPVHYLDDLETYVDPDSLEWKPVTLANNEEPPRAASLAHPDATGESRGLDMTEAKKALSKFYGVPVTSIEITIRG